MLQFIRDNIGLLEESDCYGIFAKLRAKWLKSQHPGFYFDEHGSGPFNFKFSHYETHESNAAISQRFKAMIGQMFNSVDEARLAYAYDSLKGYVFGMAPIKSGITCSVREYGMAYLLYAVEYAIRGTIGENLKTANELEKRCRGCDRVELTVEGQTITVKPFRNGRVDVKGLTDEQATRLLTLWKLCTERRHSEYQNK